MPRVFNRRTDTIPPDAVYVGRAMPRYGMVGSKWGNPYKFPTTSCPTRRDAIDAYELYIKVGAGAILPLEELRGRDLVCWCHMWDGVGPNPRYCHADILLEMANKE